MTCIAGFTDKKNVWIGGDSAGVAGYNLTVRADKKVFIKDDFIFGFTSSFRMGQLLRYKLAIPFHKPNISTEEYLYTEFIEAVRECFKSGGYTKVDSNRESGGCFLFGYRGRLFLVDDDFQIGESYNGYDAVGCGKGFALGSLYSSSGTPENRVRKALEAAEAFSAGVRSPFLILRGGCMPCTSNQS